MKFFCYDDEYKFMADILIRHINEIVDRADADNEYCADWHFFDYIADYCDGKEYISGYISEVLNGYGYLCEVYYGCESVTVVFEAFDKVLKISQIAIDESNEFICHLPEEYQEFFAEHYHLGTLEERITRKDGYTFTGGLYFFLQDKVDGETKEGKSNRSYGGHDDCFRSEVCLATIGEHLVPNGDEDEIIKAIEEFKEACYQAFESSEMYGEIDLHNGNWGMRNGMPIIFDPIFFED